MRPDVARSIAETAITNVALGGLGIATGVIVARWLGPVGRGELAAIQMWPSAMATVAMIGLPEALVYFSAKAPVRIQTVSRQRRAHRVVVIPVFAVLGYALMPFLYRCSPIGSSRGHVSICGFCRSTLWSVFPIQLLRGINAGLPALERFPIRPGGAVARGPRARSVAGEQPIQSGLPSRYVGLLAAIGAVMTWMVWRRAAGPAAPTRAAVRSMVRFGFPSALSTLPQFFNLRLDQMAVAAVLPARQLGVYMTAVAWSGCIPMLSSALAVSCPRGLPPRR